MKIIEQFKGHVSGLKSERASLQERIADAQSKISEIEHAALLPTDVTLSLSRMVSAGADRYKKRLLEYRLDAVIGKGGVTGLNCRAHQEKILDPLFINGFKDSLDVESLCFFFGDIINEKLTQACEDFTPAGGYDQDNGLPMDARLDAIKKLREEIEALELQVEDIDAALHDARMQIESLPTL